MLHISLREYKTWATLTAHHLKTINIFTLDTLLFTAIPHREGR